MTGSRAAGAAVLLTLLAVLGPPDRTGAQSWLPEELGGSGRPKPAAQLPSPPGERPVPPASPVPPPPSDPDEATRRAEIDRLRAQIAAREGLTRVTVTPLADPREVIALLRRYRRLADGMRAELYLPDPAAGSPVSQAVAAFEQRWGDLLVPILSGQRPDQPLPAARWQSLAPGLKGDACPASATAAPAGPVTLDGRRWACLTDTLVRELTDIERGVARRMDAFRAQLTEPLRQALQDAEQRMDALRAQQAAPALWLGDMTWRLHLVWLEGARLRLRELEHLQAAPSHSNPAFRRLRLLSPVVQPSRGATEPLTPIVVPPGATIRIRVDSAERTVTAESAPATPGPVVRLYRIAHLADDLESVVDRRLDDEIDAYEDQLETRDIGAGDLDLRDPARRARRHEEVRRERARRRAEEVSKARAELGRERERLLKAIEAPGP